MIGNLLCDLLFRGDDEGDILILHHAPATDRMFLAWVLNHYGAEAIAPIWPSGYQTGSDPLPEMGQLLDAAGSLRSRTVRRTTDRNAWKHCIAWPAERAGPAHQGRHDRRSLLPLSRFRSGSGRGLALEQRHQGAHGHSGGRYGKLLQGRRKCRHGWGADLFWPPSGSFRSPQDATRRVLPEGRCACVPRASGPAAESRRFPGASGRRCIRPALLPRVCHPWPAHGDRASRWQSAPCYP